MLVPPLPETVAGDVALEKSPGIASTPELDVIADEMALPVLLKLGDDISTDDIMPAGTRVMPWWSHIPRTSEFTFDAVDGTYPGRAKAVQDAGGHAIVAGNDYGQGSSRGNAALAPCYLGLRVVAARSFARIHWQNLVNFGVLPLTFADPADCDALRQGDVLRIAGLRRALQAGPEVRATVERQGGGQGRAAIRLRHDLSERQLRLLLAGGVVNWLRDRLGAGDAERTAAPREAEPASVQ